MAAVATTKLRSVSKTVAQNHEKCAKQADDIVKHAKCVARLLDVPVTMPSDMNMDAKMVTERIKATKMAETIDVTGASPRVQRFKGAKTIQYHDPSRPTTPAASGIERIGAFDVLSRKKREIIRRSDYVLPNSHDSMLFDKLAQSLLNLVLQVRADGSLKTLEADDDGKTAQNVTIFDKIAKNLLKNVITVDETAILRGLASDDTFNGDQPLSEVPETVLFDKVAHNLLQHVLTARAEASDEVEDADDFDSDLPDGQETSKRTKRFTRKNSEGYSVPDPHHGTSLFGTIAKNLLKDVLHFKNKTTAVPWQAMVAEAQETAALKKKIKQKARQHSEDMLPYEKLAYKGQDDRAMFEDIIDTMEDGTAEDRSKMIQKLKTIRKDPTGKMLDLLREGLKLGAAMSGKNASEFDEKQLNVMSPRFLSVSEKDTEDDDDINMLSPSIFSLHDNGKGLEKELSLPHLLKGFAGADQQAWLDLIFEASGVDESIKEAKNALTAQEFQITRKKRYQETMVDENGEPLFFTKESAKEKLGDETVQNYEVVEELIKTYSKEQQRDMNETGYTMMTADQLQLIYGEDSPHNNSMMIELYSNRTKESLNEQLISEIRALAKLNGTARHKRAIILSPVLFGSFIGVPEAVSQPLILSPLLFTSIPLGSSFP
uniref:Ku_PK_bind domain-containing protein n=1 Tax=Panagrellus redivivus TaxID=6233 RepID=A0A7E4VAM9_PANRE